MALLKVTHVKRVYADSVGEKRYTGSLLINGDRLAKFKLARLGNAYAVDVTGNAGELSVLEAELKKAGSGALPLDDGAAYPYLGAAVYGLASRVIAQKEREDYARWGMPVPDLD